MSQRQRVLAALDANPELGRYGQYPYEYFPDVAPDYLQQIIAQWRGKNGRRRPNCKELVMSALDDHPEWGEYGKTRPLYERFCDDCAKSTIQHYVSVWRKQRESRPNGKWALPAATVTTMCSECPYRATCHALESWLLPTLCENVPESLQQFYQHWGAWGDVLQSRVEVGGER